MRRSARWLKFIETLPIRTRDRRVIPLRYNDPQQRVWARVQDKIDHLEPIRLIILKARRHGISTEIESWLMTFVASGDNVNALITAHMKKPAQKIWNMSKLFVNGSPLIKKLATIGNSTITIGRSTLEVATAGSPESERGGDLTAWHASEASRYPHPEVMTATMQSLPHSKSIFSIGVIESTANGMEGDGEDFYDEWNRAVDGDSEWDPIFLAWHTFPEYVVPRVLALEGLNEEEYELRQRFELTDGQLAWRRWSIKNNCKDRVQLFRQEYPACVRAGTRVSTDLGILRIEDARQARQTESGTIRAWGPQPPSLLYRLETTAGRALDATGDHPVRLDSGHWQALSELQAGDAIRLLPPRFAECPHLESWQTIPAVTSTLPVSEDLARLLGYFLGDGSWYKGQFGIACDAQDGDVVEEVKDLVRRLLGEPKVKMVGRIQGRKGCAYVNIHRMAALPVLHHLEVVAATGGGYYKKRLAVPDCIWRSPRSVVSAFLSGLFEADGSGSGGHVKFYSKSLEFIRAVQLLLLGFGIPVVLRAVTKQAGNGKEYRGWEFKLGRVATEIFRTQIGFRSARKQARITKGPITRGRPPHPIELRDTVASVTLLHEEVSWDLTVEPTHVFSANGIETHNTAEEAFIQSGLPFFQPHELLWLNGHVRDGIKGTVDPEGAFRRAPDGYLEIFQPPQPGHTYVIGGDSSMGMPDRDDRKEHSRSAGCVLDMDTLEQVAEYDAASAPHIFARHLVGMARLYNNALLAPEVQSSGGGGGREVLVYVREMGYWNLHPWKGDPDKIRRPDAILYGWECPSADAKILTADLRWIAAEQIKVGDRLLGCREAVTGGKGSAIPLRLQTVTQTRVFIAPMVEVTLVNGQQTRVTPNHPFLVFRQSRKDVGWRWVQADHLRPGDCVRYLPLWEPDRTYEAGRLSAFLDGEGHLARATRQGGYQMLVTQAQGLLAEEIADLWSLLGFTATFKWLRHKDRPREQNITTSGVLRLVDVLRALGSLRPTRLLRKFDELAERGVMTLRAIPKVAVASIRDVGEGPVVGLTTDPDHTLIADGIVGHNTNSRTRPRMLARIREIVMEKSSIIHSRRLFKQLSAFGEDDHGHMEALAGRDDLLFAFGIALMSRSENWYRAPVQTESSVPMPDWAAMGIHVLHPESAGDRLRRLLLSSSRDPEERTFLES